MKKKFLSLLLILILSNLSSCTLNSAFSLSTTKTTTPSTSNTSSISSAIDTTTKPINNNYYKIDEVNHNYHDLGLENKYYNWHYMNSIGDQKILVVPVIISDYSENATEKVKEDLNIALFSDGENERIGYESLRSFYYKSSYGKLNLSGTITSWMAGYDSEDLFFDPYDDEFDPLYVLYDDFDGFIDKEIDDLTIYDSDKDGYIDLVIFVYSAPDNEHDPSLDDNYWAYTNSCEYKIPNVEHPTLNNYIWVSYDFLYEEDYNNGYYLSAYTFIHEFGHALGLDDYYGTDYYDLTGSSVVMSSCIGDHDAFSKFSLSWINPYVVYGDAVITINSFYKSGDAIILPIIPKEEKEFDNNAFSEYLIFEYYTVEGMNAKCVEHTYDNYPAINGSGIRVFYINAKLAYDDSRGKTHAVDYYYEYDDNKGEGLLPAFSNYYSIYDVRDKSEPALIKLLDKSNNSIYKSTTSATHKVLYKDSSYLRTRDFTFYGSRTLDYYITFTKNKDDSFTITFHKN